MRTSKKARLYFCSAVIFLLLGFGNIVFGSRSKSDEVSLLSEAAASRTRLEMQEKELLEPGLSIDQGDLLSSQLSHSDQERLKARADFYSLVLSGGYFFLILGGGFLVLTAWSSKSG